MNEMAPIKIDEIETQAGTQLVFDRVDTGWTIKSGRAELFLVAIEDGVQVSRGVYAHGTRVAGSGT